MLSSFFILYNYAPISPGHVIPGRQLLPVALAQGPTGTTLDFTFQSREKPLVVSTLSDLQLEQITSIFKVCDIATNSISDR